MAYIVLARKWRPQTFEEVVGQEHITKTLTNSIEQGRVAHAYLFAGPRGVGKTTTARILAKALNCERGPAPVPCNSCTNCKEITDGKSLDVLEIDGASNRGIDEIRNLRDNVKLAPANSRYKVYIIDEVHMLTIHAFNALLKTLEEPPSHVVFMLATTAPNKLPATILSRCQRFNLKRIKIYDIIKKLRDIAQDEGLKIDDQTMLLIARSVQGSMRDGMSILDQLISFRGKEIRLVDVRTILGLAPQEAFLGLTKAIIDRDTKAALAMVEDLVDQGYDIPRFVGDLMEHFRDLAVVRLKEDLVDLPEDTIEQLRGQSQHFSLDSLLRMMDILSETQEEMRSSDQKRLFLEVLVTRLTRLEPLVRLDEVLQRLEALESRLTSSHVEGLASTSQSQASASEEASQSVPDEAVPGPLRQQSKTSPLRQRSEASEPRPFGREVKLEEIRKAWPEIVEEVRRVKPYVGAFLAKGEPVEADKGGITVGFDKGFFKESVEDVANRKIVEAGVGKVLGRRIRVRYALNYTTGRGAPANKDKESLSGQQQADVLKEPIVKAALDIFNGKVVEIIPSEASSEST
jgi:DNA polymerase-3 subunit gamma/tau